MDPYGKRIQQQILYPKGVQLPGPEGVPAYCGYSSVFGLNPAIEVARRFCVNVTC